MRKIKLTKIIASMLLTVSVLGLNSISASAEWKQNSNGWWYSEGSGWVTGKKLIDGHNYYFDSNGYMKNGWIREGNNWFYYDDYGYPKRGWLQDGGKWYYLNKIGGAMITNEAVDGWYLNKIGVGTKCENLGDYEMDRSTGTITKYTGNDTSVVIPREIGGIEIKRIVEKAFDNCISITSITIPDSVTYIDNYAFSNCNNLKSITIDDNNKYYASVDGILFNKSRDKIIKYPMGKENKSYVIPSSVDDIDSDAFYNCINLTNITIPTGTLDIGKDVFDNCTNATFYIGDAEIKKRLISDGIPESKIILDSKILGIIQPYTNNSNVSSVSENNNKNTESLKDDETFKAINSLDNFDTTKYFNFKIRLNNIRTLEYYKLIEPFKGKSIVSKTEIDSNHLQSKIESQLFMGTFNNKVFIFADSKCTEDNLEKDGTYIVKGAISINRTDEIIKIKESHNSETFYWKWDDKSMGGRYIDCSQKVIDFEAKEGNLIEIKDGKPVRVSKTIDDFRDNNYSGLQSLYLTNIISTDLYAVIDSNNDSKRFCFVDKEELDKRGIKSYFYKVFIGDFDGVNVAFVDKNFSISKLDANKGSQVYGYIRKFSEGDNEEIPTKVGLNTYYVDVDPIFLCNLE